LVTGNVKGEIALIDIHTRKVLKTFGSGIEPLLHLAVNPDGNMLAVSNKSNVVTTFSLKNKISISGLYGHKKQISGIHFSSDSSLLSTASDNRIFSWNLNQNVSRKIKGNSNPALWNNILNLPVYSLFLNSITSYYLVKHFVKNNQETLETSAISSDDSLLATGGRGFNKGLFYNWFVPRIFPVHVVDASTLKKKVKISAHYLSVDALAFNRNHSLLATSGKDYKTGVSDIKNPRKTLSAFALFVPLLGIYEAVKAFYARQTYGSLYLKNLRYPVYNSLKIWNIEHKKLLKTFDFPDKVKAIQYSPVNDTMLVSDDKNNVMLLDLNRDSVQKFTKGSGPLLFNSDGKSFYFQDNTHSLQRYDLANRKCLSVYKGHSDSITGIAFIDENKRIATSSLDGSVKIWDVKTGKEIATLYAINSSDYIIKTPDYYYYATKNAKKEIGFTFGIKFYPFEQFDLQYNRPDIVLARLECATPDMVNALHLAYQKRLQKSGFSEEMFSTDFHLPELQLVDAEKIPLSVKQAVFSFSIKANDSKYKLDRVNVWINDVPLYGSKGFSLREMNTFTFQKDIQVSLSEGLNIIRFSCMNEKGVESLKETAELVCSPEQNEKPDLYVVSIGASEYAEKEWNLNYAAKDAGDVASLFEAQKADYNHINTYKILNNDVTIENIKKIKEVLKQTKVNDKVLIFYAGHGLLDDKLDYYLGTYDIDFNHPSLRGLPYDELNTLLDSIPAREKLLLIDACHSGEVDKEQQQQMTAQVDEKSDIKFRGIKPRGFNGTSTISYNNSFELMKELFSDLRAGTGAVVISSAGGGEYAFEGEQWKNGVFTYSLREGLLNGLADKNHDNRITVSELQNFVLNNVLKLTGGKQKPTMRQENIDNDFVIWEK
jgi:WD40 repeat protein